MKKDIHPDYHPVIIRDASCGFAFLTRSTATSPQIEKWEDGKEYPVITVETSSASHPFFTGQQKLIDTAGRIEKFEKKFGGRVSSKGEAKPTKERVSKQKQKKESIKK